jgi:hypothetical protein
MIIKKKRRENKPNKKKIRKKVSQLDDEIERLKKEIAETK